MLLFITVSHICCKQTTNKQDKENVMYEDKYKLEDYVTKKFKIYELKNDIAFISLLDSVINTIQCYPRIRNLQICFTLLAINENRNTRIDIELYDYKHNDVLLGYDTDALFFYRGYIFMYYGKLFNDFFIDTNTYVERNCIKPLGDYNDSVYHLIYWRYVYKNNKFNLVDFSESYD
jgi:hypothetical protein